MMKKVLSVLLVCMILATMVSVPAFAAEAETYALTDLLGDFYAIRDTKSNLQATSSNALWQTPSDGVAALGSAGDAVEMTFKVNMDLTDTDSAANFVIYDANGGRVYMQIHDTGAWISSEGNTSAFFADADIEKMRNVECTLLYVNNGSNYSVYMKENGSYRHLITTVDRRSGTGTAAQISAVSTTTVDIASITYYDNFVGSSYYLRDVMEAASITSNTTHVLADSKSPLGSTGDFVEFKFNTGITIDGANDQYVEILMADDDKNYAQLRIHESGAWVNGAAESLSADAVAKIRNVDATMLVANHGTNFSLYVKNANGGYEKIFTSSGKTTQNTYATRVILNVSGATLSLDYVKCYESVGLTDSATAVDGCYSLVEQDFATAINGAHTKGENVTVQNGALNIPAGEEVSLTGAPMPVGGYADVRVKTANNLWIKMSDGVTAGYDTQFKLVAGGSSLYYPFTSCLGYINNRTTEWHTYRFVKNTAGTFSIYHKGENDKAWVAVATNIDTSARNATSNAISFVAENGAAQVDYVKVYGPVAADSVTITDGAYKTASLANSAAITTDSVRAIVSGKKGTLIFAGYGEGDKLLVADPRQVDGTAAAVEEVFDATVAAGITKVKVFLWDDFSSMQSQTSARDVVIQ